MEEQLISFETAKLAKEKGFNINTSSYYLLDKIEYESFPKTNWNKNEDTISQSSQSLLQKWLREIHKIEVMINRIPPEAVKASTNGLKDYTVYIWNQDSNPRVVGNSKFGDSYEEALEVGLQEALKLI